jgi:hypothetical protein
MLTWTKTNHGWDCSEFQIQYAGPHRWLLMPQVDPGSLGSVRILGSPLATTGTLSACKREAEQIVATRSRRELQRRHIGLGLAAATGALLATGLAWPWNFLISSGLALTAVRSLGVFVGALLGPRLPLRGDLFYQ